MTAPSHSPASDPITITCLIPAWNEAARIGAVLAAVRATPGISKLVVIDDGSTDQTAHIARACGAMVVQTPGNQGKTGALALGLAGCDTSHVLLLDADLTGLTPAAISALIAPVLTGRADATVSLRGNAPLAWRLLGIDYISGERVLPLGLLAGQQAALASLPGFGFEVFLNRLLISNAMQISVVRWPGVASPSKAEKRGFWSGLRADAAMMADIFRTIQPAETLLQIRALRRMRSA